MFGKQRVTNGGQSAPKGAQRVPQGGPKATQRLLNGPRRFYTCLGFGIHGGKGVPEEPMAPKRHQKAPQSEAKSDIFASKIRCRSGAKNFEK